MAAGFAFVIGIVDAVGRLCGVRRDMMAIVSAKRPNFLGCAMVAADETAAMFHGSDGCGRNGPQLLSP